MMSYMVLRADSQRVPEFARLRVPENVSLERAWCSVLLVGFTGLQLWAVGGQEQSFRALY